MKVMIWFIASILFTSCSTKAHLVKSKECNTNVLVTKYKVKKKDLLGEGKLVEKGSHFYIYFTENYDKDNIEATINGKLLFDKMITTDKSLGTTEAGFYYNYKNNDALKLILKVKNKNDCFDITLDKNYRQLFIYSLDNKWEVIYDNIYPLYE